MKKDIFMDFIIFLTHTNNNIRYFTQIRYYEETPS
jgi:hypothetical protein